MPVSLPLSDGMTLPTALAAPVAAGMMFWPAPRPPRQSLPEGPSTVFWVAVVAWTVVIRPSTMPYSSWMILASGPRQLVVHDAFERMLMSLVYDRWLTPMTNMGASAEGAEMMTFLAPPCRCIDAFSITVKMPVDSHTTSAPFSPHGTSVGFLTARNAMVLPSTMREDDASSYETVPLYMPCVESYLKRYAAYLTSQNGSFTATTSAPSFIMAARQTRRPMRPKPETPILTMIARVLFVLSGAMRRREGASGRR
mmetsp:Transcript_25407/g.66992  ORF Transcript_25407/g.66992 Transcript_25407/m.66992 type:complete len:254 (-) Transcript_25407:7-768(-)